MNHCIRTTLIMLSLSLISFSPAHAGARMTAASQALAAVEKNQNASAAEINDAIAKAKRFTSTNPRWAKRINALEKRVAQLPSAAPIRAVSPPPAAAVRPPVARPSGIPTISAPRLRATPAAVPSAARAVSPARTPSPRPAPTTAVRPPAAQPSGIPTISAPQLRATPAAVPSATRAVSPRPQSRVAGAGVTPPPARRVSPGRAATPRQAAATAQPLSDYDRALALSEKTAKAEADKRAKEEEQLRQAIEESKEIAAPRTRPVSPPSRRPAARPLTQREQEQRAAQARAAAQSSADVKRAATTSTAPRAPQAVRPPSAPAAVAVSIPQAAAAPAVRRLQPSAVQRAREERVPQAAVAAPAAQDARQQLKAQLINLVKRLSDSTINQLFPEIEQLLPQTYILSEQDIKEIGAIANSKGFVGIQAHITTGFEAARKAQAKVRLAAAQPAPIPVAAPMPVARPAALASTPAPAPTAAAAPARPSTPPPAIPAAAPERKAAAAVSTAQDARQQLKAQLMNLIQQLNDNTLAPLIPEIEKLRPQTYILTLQDINELGQAARDKGFAGIQGSLFRGFEEAQRAQLRTAAPMPAQPAAAAPALPSTPPPAIPAPAPESKAAAASAIDLLHRGIETENPALIKQATELDKNIINKSITEHNDTPLLWAVKLRKSLPTIEALLNAGAQTILARDTYGEGLFSPERTYQPGVLNVLKIASIKQTVAQAEQYLNSAIESNNPARVKEFLTVNEPFLTVESLTKLQQKLNGLPVNPATTLMKQFIADALKTKREEAKSAGTPAPAPESKVAAAAPVPASIPPTTGATVKEQIIKILNQLKKPITEAEIDSLWDQIEGISQLSLLSEQDLADIKRVAQEKGMTEYSAGILVRTIKKTGAEEKMAAAQLTLFESLSKAIAEDNPAFQKLFTENSSRLSVSDLTQLQEHLRSLPSSISRSAMNARITEELTARRPQTATPTRAAQPQAGVASAPTSAQPVAAPMPTAQPVPSAAAEEKKIAAQAVPATTEQRLINAINSNNFETFETVLKSSPDLSLEVLNRLESHATSIIDKKAVARENVAALMNMRALIKKRKQGDISALLQGPAGGALQGAIAAIAKEKVAAQVPPSLPTTPISPLPTISAMSPLEKQARSEVKRAAADYTQAANAADEAYNHAKTVTENYLNPFAAVQVSKEEYDAAVEASQKAEAAKERAKKALQQAHEALAKAGTVLAGEEKLGAASQEEKDKLLLFYAMSLRGGDRSEIEKALAQGANINAQDQDGNTALMIAIEEGYIDAANYLIEKGADVNITNKKGKSALVYALDELSVAPEEEGEELEAGFAEIKRKVEFIKLLLSKGAIITPQVREAADDADAVQIAATLGIDLKELAQPVPGEEKRTAARRESEVAVYETGQEEGKRAAPERPKAAPSSAFSFLFSEPATSIPASLTIALPQQLERKEVRTLSVPQQANLIRQDLQKQAVELQGMATHLIVLEDTHSVLKRLIDPVKQLLNLYHKYIEAVTQFSDAHLAELPKSTAPKLLAAPGQRPHYQLITVSSKGNRILEELQKEIAQLQEEIRSTTNFTEQEGIALSEMPKTHPEAAQTIMTAYNLQFAPAAPETMTSRPAAGLPAPGGQEEEDVFHEAHGSKSAAQLKEAIDSNDYKKFEKTLKSVQSNLTLEDLQELQVHLNSIDRTSEQNEMLDDIQDLIAEKKGQPEVFFEARGLESAVPAPVEPVAPALPPSPVPVIPKPTTLAEAQAAFNKAEKALQHATEISDAAFIVVDRENSKNENSDEAKQARANYKKLKEITDQARAEFHIAQAARDAFVAQAPQGAGAPIPAAAATAESKESAGNTLLNKLFIALASSSPENFKTFAESHKKELAQIIDQRNQDDMDIIDFVKQLARNNPSAKDDLDAKITYLELNLLPGKIAELRTKKEKENQLFAEDTAKTWLHILKTNLNAPKAREAVENIIASTRKKYDTISKRFIHDMITEMTKLGYNPSKKEEVAKWLRISLYQQKLATLLENEFEAEFDENTRTYYDLIEQEVVENETLKQELLTYLINLGSREPLPSDAKVMAQARQIIDKKIKNEVAASAGKVAAETEESDRIIARLNVLTTAIPLSDAQKEEANDLIQKLRQIDPVAAEAYIKTLKLNPAAAVASQEENEAFFD